MTYLLRYLSPAPDSGEGWEKYSLPVGCSALGANVFGGLSRERIQITENSTENPGELGGLNSFADLYFDFPHENAENYERSLCLNDAAARVRCDVNGVRFERTVFASYPEKALILRFTASEKGALSFAACVSISHLTDEEKRRKTGRVFTEGQTIFMEGRMEAYNLRFAGALHIETDGAVTPDDGGRLRISGATEAWMIFVPATNYVLSPHVFAEPDNRKKLPDTDPMPLCREKLAAALAYDYETLRARQLADYTALFGRVSLDLGESDVPALPTDELLEAYGKGERSRYLEALYFQFGRYLLISSSRTGCLPANLQGVWNCHDRSPWGAGYWHNINVQMNYWPAFVTGLAETFPAYLSYYEAFLPTASRAAADFVKATVPENYHEGEDCGWTIGTANYAYSITGPGSHSGPGTGGLTSKLFWEYYDFTRDEKILREVTCPALMSMARFLTKVVRDYDGKELSVFSASPEQKICEARPGQNMIYRYYQTVGCAFDQQMIWENGNDLLKCAALLGDGFFTPDEKKVLDTLREQIGRYDPVQVGWSGQVKEYREETFYGLMGEFRHRHISQLVGLYPGTSITHDTPAWLDAARVSLNLRSDESTGWALAHRLNAWARTGDGNRALKLYSNLIGMRTLPNLWDFHPPFQIDGNLGGTSGVAEMLLQSHEGAVAPLACLPDDWENGSYTGLAARGGFTVDAAWSHHSADTVTIHSSVGGVCRLRLANAARAKADFPFAAGSDDLVVFDTVPGGVYRFTEIPKTVKKPVPETLRVTRSLDLSWDFAEPVNIWRAEDSAPDYVLCARNVTGGSWHDRSADFANFETLTYKITRADTLDPSSDGAYRTLNHSTRLERDRYRRIIAQINLGHRNAVDLETVNRSIGTDE